MHFTVIARTPASSCADRLWLGGSLIINRYASDSSDLLSVYFLMESHGDNAFLAAVGWVYRLFHYPLTTQRVPSESIVVPKSHGIGDNDAIPSTRTGSWLKKSF
jgi:hypothetical protein